MDPMSMKLFSNRLGVKSEAETFLLKAFLFSFCLSIAKFAGYALTGSLIILTSAFDSLSDTLTSWFNSRMQRLAHKDPDAEHPFGHSGYDVVSGLVQGSIMLCAGFFLCHEVVTSFLEYLQKPPSKELNTAFAAGLAVLLIAALGGGFISLYLKRAERKLKSLGQRSISLHADIAHYRSDMLTNSFQLIGFALVYYSGIFWLEYVFSGVGIGVILHSGWSALRLSFRDIMQTDETAIFKDQLAAAIIAADSRVKDVHRLRVRTHGVKRFVDFHLTLPEQLTLREAHEIGETVTKVIAPMVPAAEIMVHFDPDSFPTEPEFGG